jgi:hypothetical protein
MVRTYATLIQVLSFSNGCNHTKLESPTLDASIISTSKNCTVAILSFLKITEHVTRWRGFKFHDVLTEFYENRTISAKILMCVVEMKGHMVRSDIVNTRI